MEHKLVKVGTGEHTWQALVDDWRRQTEAFEVEFDETLQLTASVLKPLAEQDNARAGVYAHHRDGTYWATCQINTAYLPGFNDPVMRVRFLAFSPTIDLGEDNIDLYATTLVEVFLNVIALCLDEGEMAAKHIHFHLRSPQDRQFFALLGRNVADQGVFKKVDARGAWLYISL